MSRLLVYRQLSLIPIIVTGVLFLYFIVIPILLLAFPQFLRISLIGSAGVFPDPIIPSNLTGRLFYIRQGNTMLGGWHIVPKQWKTKLSSEGAGLLSDRSLRVIVIFHGAYHDRHNKDRMKFYQHLMKEDLQLLMFSMRGFGDSAGTVDAESAIEDVERILEYVDSHAGDNSITLWAYSLGTTVVPEAIRRFPVRKIDMMIMESAIHNTADPMWHGMQENLKGFFPNKYKDLVIVPAMKEDDIYLEPFRVFEVMETPVLFLYSEDDPIVPRESTEKIVKEARAHGRGLVFYASFPRCRKLEHNVGNGMTQVELSALINGLKDASKVYWDCKETKCHLKGATATQQPPPVPPMTTTSSPSTSTTTTPTPPPTKPQP